MKPFFQAFGKAMLYALAYFLIRYLAVYAYSALGGFVFLIKFVLQIMTNPFELSKVFDIPLDTHALMLQFLSDGAAVLILFLFFAIRRKKFSRAVHFNKCSKGSIFASVLLGIGLSFASAFLIRCLSFPESIAESYASRYSHLSAEPAAIGFILVAIFAPIAEEIYFRGLVYPHLRAGMHFITAGLLSAAACAICQGYSLWLLDAFITGFALAWVFELTGSLYPCIAAHIASNTAAVAFTPFTETSCSRMLCFASVGILLVIGAAICLKKANVPVARNDPENPQ